MFQFCNSQSFFAGCSLVPMASSSCIEALGFFHGKSDTPHCLGFTSEFSQSALPKRFRRLALQERNQPRQDVKFRAFYKTHSTVVSRRFSLLTAVSTVPVDFPSQSAFSPPNLAEELCYMKDLLSSLVAANTTSEKVTVLDRQTRVKAFFGRDRQINSNGKVGATSALRRLGERELYLLKCLIAIGQEHVLYIDSSWHESEQDVENGVQGSSPLKSAFLLNMIEKWDNPGGSVPNSSFLNLMSYDGNAKQVNGTNEAGRDGTFVALRRLVTILEEMETFYDCIGGIVGYQVAVLELILASKSEGHSMSCHFCEESSSKDILKEFYVPTGLDLSKNTKYAAQAAIWGIEGLPKLGEIYPLGGSGDRLGLIDDETGHCLPVAMLPYCGRTLLEGLIRDLQAREFLYYKIYGKQQITPVAIMTSAAKDNCRHIQMLCERHKWFGRGRGSFRLFDQPLVPTVGAEDGQWLTSGPFKLVLKPGGHGVIWKLASDRGVFDWFYRHGCKAATVRQISNPVAATDATLLALAGIGLHHGKKLGFASCQRNVGATEGVNILMERSTADGCWEYGITCIEYTEFDKMGITDAPVSPGSIQAQYPANTNVLYVDLTSVERIGASKTTASLPGMILNLKKPITYEDYLGARHSVYAGRLECTMQNVADSLLTSFPSRCYSRVQESMDTFIVYNERRKVTSSAKKRRRQTDKSLHQTPDGSLLDITRNAYDLLVSCNVKMQKVEDNSCYLHSGPPFLVLLHPALGPLWEVIRQKFHGGSIAKGSELQVEVAEFLWKDVQLDGSLIILAENIMGSIKPEKNGETMLQYGEQCGRCRLKNVKISNKGIDWSCSKNVYWQHKVHRLEMVKIVLHGNAEFEAYDVVLEGTHTFEVPEGQRLQVTNGKIGLSCTMQPIMDQMASSGSWFWQYTVQNSHVHLEMVEL